MTFQLRFVAPTLLVVRCLSAAVPITITSSPAGLSFTVEGSGCNGAYQTPQTLSWTAGASCTVRFISRYVFRGWEDGVASNPRVIVTPGQASTYSATFAANLAGPPGNYLVTQIASNYSYTSAINNYGQVAGNNPPFLWTPLAANGAVGNVAAMGGLTVPDSGSQVGGINDRGQVTGTTAGTAQVFLWSPDSPNGTTGTMTSPLGSTQEFAISINGFGQIAGDINSTSFIWTPAAPNGATGTVITFARSDLGRLNDFGQAIFGTAQPGLFTPSVANGVTGSLTEVPGLPGETSHQLSAINRSGTIAGASCIPAASGPCKMHTFLWTPTTSNGTTGTTVEIPLPAGYVSMGPTALNASGQVVGSITASGGAITPFLYTGGTVYDLSVLGTQLAGGYIISINDPGQILVSVPSGVFLLTPGLAPVPGPGTVAITIASSTTDLGTQTPQAFTVSGAGCAAGGYTTPQTLYWTPGSNCTVAFLSPHSMQIGTRYVFNGWQDGAAANPRAIVAPTQAATYTANFTTQFLLTVVANPPEGGTVSGGGWYNSGSMATLVAAPASGYVVAGWSYGAPAGSTTATVSVNPSVPITVTFVPVPPTQYLVSRIATGLGHSVPSPINNFGQVVGLSYNPGALALLWTPIAANSPVGSVTDIGGLPIGVPAGNQAVAINDLGQVIGTTNNQPFLWSPTTPNGTSGTATAFLGSLVTGTPYLVSINSYGQIAGSQDGGFSSFIWTPSSPNGTTGTLNVDSGLNGLAGINDFGQAIMYQGVLFTPSVAQGSTGSFTTISGPQGATLQLVAINSSGTILGTTCFKLSDGYCSWHTYLWTPTTPNSATGTLAEIALPGDFLSMTPTAMNAVGQVVGTMTRNNVWAPFLYTGGKVYDLSVLSAQLAGGTPAINDRGEIVVNANGALYLLTPAPPAGQGTVAVTIAASSPLEAFTVTGSGCGAGGYVAPQTLNWTPGASCTVTFVSPHSSSVGTREVFAGWTDSVGANPRIFVAPAQAATYTANFSSQLLLAATANPPGGGTISGGGWYAPGTTVTLTATPSPGYRLLDWMPPSLAAAGATSATVTIQYPQSATVNFGLLAAMPPIPYQLTLVGPPNFAFAATAKPINNFGQVLMFYGGALWTPVTANSPSGGTTQLTNLPGIDSVWASAINDQGQVAGATYFDLSVPTPFVWSPTMANGTSGTGAAFMGKAYAGALDINDFGEIGGQLSNSGFLWTPSAANGSTGTLTTDSRFNLLKAINNFGQAIMNGSPVTPTLFTPSAAHGGAGTYTAIAGLAGATGTLLADIDGNGRIVGSSCIPTGFFSQCSNHLFLWTPTSPNGASGSAGEIPLPGGIASMTPVALNAAGQIAGNMTLANGVGTAFLYSGGSVYDLSNIVSGPAAAGINDRGQIAINGNGGVYLLTPVAVPPPAPVAVTPAAGNLAGQTLTFTFSDPRGWQDLDVVNILINNFLDGRNACYLAYSRPQNVLYLVNDAGTALVPGGGTANSQCAVSLAAPAAGLGNTLTLTLSLTFAAGFAGNQVIYMAARDVAQNNSGWQALGTWTAPGAAAGPVAAAGVTPARGSGSHATFTFTFTDTKGWQDLGVADMLINSSLDGRSACYLAYSRAYNVLYLVDDAGASLLPGTSNSQCAIDPRSFSVNGAGNTLTLTVSLTFLPGFAGNQVIYLAARDSGDVNNSGWQAMGSWTSGQ